ncbi:MAG: MFS transporter [Chlamydiae bacterium]|nr:MFS transporter [Chlamydiota bacterium]
MTIVEFSKKERRSIVLAVSVGNLLEWYEIYLYVYWAPIISKLFFHCSSDLMGLIYTYLIFGLGFLARPLGGVFFGRLGDRIGRKKAMILSLVIMIFPTFITGLLPTFKQIGHFAPCILALMRILQAFPAGGELPGAACYLYESARRDNRKYLSSWSSVGFQMGILLSTLECFFLERFLPTKDLLEWGWRVSFLVGGLIGLLGLFLRCKLHETPLFQEMVKHEKVVREPLISVFRKNKVNLFRASFFCVLNSASFYLITVNFPMYFSQIFASNSRLGLIVTSVILLIITLPLPFFGVLAEKYSYKKMLIYSTIGSILLLFPLYLAMNSASLLLMSITVFFFSLLFACISAIIPYAICDVFPTYSRFTCVGVSFNVVDALIGGFTPAIALVLLRTTGNRGSICWFLFACALISLFSYFKIKESPKGEVESF